MGHVPTLILSSHRRDRFGVVTLQQVHDSEITQSLSSDYSGPLHEDFFLDAQAAAVDGNIPRAIVELAIACEVATKRKFFGGSTASALTVEHLEDRNMLRLHVVKLIDATSTDVFGVSFKEMYERDYGHIDELFRCRNKLVHRGRPQYKDDRGTLHVATCDTLEQWFASARVMIDWLATLHVQPAV